MKKYILCCIAALCSTFGMAADNISVQYEQVVRGETVTLSVNLNNSSSNKYVGFQMDLTLPAGSECPVRFDTVSGDFDCRGVRTDVPGEPALRIRTVSGDVTLRGK